jgi:CBS domain-containing protein
MLEAPRRRAWSLGSSAELKAEGNMRVQEAMSRDVQVCHPWEELNRAAQLMWDQDIGFVPVVGDSGTVIGVVTDRDACMAAYTRGLPLTAIRVEDAMTREIETCAPGSDLKIALALMRETRVRRLPIVDADGGLVGVLSIGDLARIAEDMLRRGDRELACDAAMTVAAICEPRFRKSEPPIQVPRRAPARKAGLMAG